MNFMDLNRPLLRSQNPTPRGAPNNAAIEAQMIRTAQRTSGRATGPLGEYIDPMYYRTLQTKGPNFVEAGVAAPTILAPETDLSTDDLLRKILEELRRMPQNLSTEARSKFGIAPRNAISFIAPSTDVTVAAGTAVAVVTQNIPESYTGFLEYVGVNVIPGAWNDITWQIRIDDARHPEFNNRQFGQNTYFNPQRFKLELPQAKQLQLVAINGAGVDIDVQGILVGWLEYMFDFLPYGGTPTAGIG